LTARSVTPCAPRKRAFGLKTASQCLLATVIVLLIGFGCDPSLPHAEERALLAILGQQDRPRQHEPPEHDAEHAPDDVPRIEIPCEYHKQARGQDHHRQKMDQPRNRECCDCCDRKTGPQSFAGCRDQFSQYAATLSFAKLAIFAREEVVSLYVLRRSDIPVAALAPAPQSLIRGMLPRIRARNGATARRRIH